MKYLFLSIAVLLTTACEKNDVEKDCKTCELQVHEVLGVGQSIDYVQETKEICNDSWKDIDGVSHVTVNGQYTHKTETWHCK